MAGEITGIRVGGVTRRIDYLSLANLPDTTAMATAISTLQRQVAALQEAVAGLTGSEDMVSGNILYTTTATVSNDMLVANDATVSDCILVL